MNLLSTENLSKGYGDKILFNISSFGIEEGEKIGLIGVNGTGKTTFLKILAGAEQPDSGRVVTGNSVRVEYMPQNPDFDHEATVLEQIFRGDSPEMQILREYEHTLNKLESHPEDEALQKKLMSLNGKMDALGIWQLESEAKTVLTKLGISDFDAKVGTLSGGQRKRIAMAAALINPSELLILDEPTNHIDNATVEWLEQYLAKRKGAFVMVTHDRYFLDKVVSKIIEIDNGRLYSYTGGYSDFLEQKALRQEQALASEEKRQNLLRKELAWIRRGAKARSTKQKARIQRFEKLQEDKYDVKDEKVEISAVSSRLGKTVIEMEHIGKSFGDKKIIDDFNYIVLRNDRVGIIGPNGTGKTTLLNLIASRLTPDSGTIKIGETVKLGYFSQETDEMQGDIRVIDYIKREAELISTPDGYTITASQMLERFLFPPNVQWTPIGKLSGGEKRRLFLLKILMGAPNVLLLDEPTNDLDIETLTILEDYLDDFAGAVISVSHDRYFLDRMAEKLFILEGDGKVAQYMGDYSDYRDYLDEKAEAQEQAKSKAKTEKKEEAPERSRERALKFTYKEQKEFETIDGVIADKEQEMKDLGVKIEKAASDFVLLQELLEKQKVVEEELDNLYERWTYLTELAEKIEVGKGQK